MSRRGLPFWLVATSTYLGQRPGIGGPLPIRWQRAWLDLMARTLPEPAGTVVRPCRLDGRPALRVSVGATERPTAIVHLHGGAYTVGSPRSHRALGAYLAKAADSVVYLPDYRLAPEHPFPAALEDAVDAAGAVAAAHDRFALSGDSAGGGLAVATARRLIDARTDTSAALGLISPWVDPAAEPTGRRRDLVVRAKWGRLSALHYLGPGDPADAGFAPGRGELGELPPTLIQVNRREVLYDQVAEFAGRLRAAGVDVTVSELPRLWHVGHVMAGVLVDAQQAVDELGGFLRARLGAVPAGVRG
ncbi:MAG TPA: alpha/beta hydrolase [Jatrophihabitans sp.]|nr:alpha/beta hydrolase [Jatrophihabitans sp.]